MAPKTAVPKLDYLVFTETDQLNAARELLRARETEHYRLWLTTPPGSDGSHLEAGEADIKRLQAEVKTLETTVSS